MRGRDTLRRRDTMRGRDTMRRRAPGDAEDGTDVAALRDHHRRRDQKDALREQCDDAAGDADAIRNLRVAMRDHHAAADHDCERLYAQHSTVQETRTGTFERAE